MSTASIQLGRTTEIPTSSWKGSMCTTTKRQVTAFGAFENFDFCAVCVVVHVAALHFSVSLSRSHSTSANCIYSAIFFSRWKICSTSCPRRFGTRHNGFSPIRSFWTNL